MKSLLQLAAALTLVILGVSAAVLTLDAHRTMRDFDASLKEQSQNLTAETARIDATINKIDATVEQLNLAAIEQRAYWQKTSADSDKTVKALRIVVDRAGLLLKHTDEQLNGSLLPDADRELTLTSQSAQFALGSLGQTSTELAFRFDDLQPSLENLADTTKNLTDASAHANAILASGDVTAAYYEKKLTTPATFAHKVALTLLDVGSKLGNIMAGFVK